MTEQITTPKIYKCVCGKQYNHQSSLSYHKSRCLMVNKDLKDTTKTSVVNIVNPMDLIKDMTEINNKQAELIITYNETNRAKDETIKELTDTLIKQQAKIIRLTELTQTQDVIVVGNRI